MPLFSSKFSPKKVPARKLDASQSLKGSNTRVQEEPSLDIEPIRIRLGDQEALFVNGEWIPETGPISGKHKENERLRHSIQRLEDENHMLKLKAEILMDMLTQTTAESHLHIKAIEMSKNSTLGTKRFGK